MSWSVRAVQLPDGDRPADLWVNRAGCLVTEPVPGAARLPGRYVAPGLVDAHAHPAVGWQAGAPVALDESQTLKTLAGWARSGVCLVRDTGSPGGSVLQLDLAPGMPRLQAAGRFLAPAGQYFPALLPEDAPQQRLTELALGELARGGRWVKVIADFPAVADRTPSGRPSPTYSGEAIQAMTAASAVKNAPNSFLAQGRGMTLTGSGCCTILPSTFPRNDSPVGLEGRPPLKSYGIMTLILRSICSPPLISPAEMMLVPLYSMNAGTVLLPLSLRYT